MKSKINKKNQNKNNKNVKSKFNNIKSKFNKSIKKSIKKSKKVMKGGVSMNPLKLISFYFYKLISKAVLINKFVKTQLETLIKNIPQNIQKTCNEKNINIKTQIINICIKILQSISIYGFIMAPNKDEYIQKKIKKMSEKNKNSNDCKQLIIKYLLQITTQGSVAVSRSISGIQGQGQGQGQGINANLSDFTKLFSSFANIAQKDKGKLLEGLTPEGSNEDITKTNELLGRMLSESPEISETYNDLEKELDKDLDETITINQAEMSVIDNTLPKEEEITDEEKKEYEGIEGEEIVPLSDEQINQKEKEFEKFKENPPPYSMIDPEQEMQTTDENLPEENLELETPANLPPQEEKLPPQEENQPHQEENLQIQEETQPTLEETQPLQPTQVENKPVQNTMLMQNTMPEQPVVGGKRNNKKNNKTKNNNTKNNKSNKNKQSKNKKSNKNKK